MDRKAYAPSIDRHVLVKKGIDAKSGLPIAVPASRAMEHAARRSIRTILNAVSTNTSDLVNVRRVQFVLNENTAHLAKDCILRFRISCSGGTGRLVPAPYWFTRIDFRDRGTDADCNYIYPECLMVYLGCERNEVLRQWAKKLGFNPRTLWKGEPIAAGESRYIYLPLPAFWAAAGAHLDFTEDLGSSLEIVLQTTGVVIADTISGTPVISMDELVLMIDSEVPSVGDKLAHQDLLRSYIPEMQYIDQQLVEYPSQSLAASSIYNWKVDQFTSKSAALVLAITPSASAASFGRLKYASLDGSGSGAGSIDLIGPSNEQLIGSGSSSPPAEYFRSVLNSRWSGDILGDNYALYVIPFTTDLDEALRGAVKGFFAFDGSSYTVRFQTPSAGTAGVVSFVQSAAADAGTFKLGWTDPGSGITSLTNELAYNASAATVKAAFEALESVQQAKILVTFNQAFSAGATVTMTVTGLNGEAVSLNNNLPLFVSELTNGGNNTTCAISESTKGIPGWAAGTYNVLIYNLYYRLIRKRPKRLEQPKNL